MDDFEYLDFEILDFINSNSPVDIETIKKRFPNLASIDYRVDAMSKKKYNSTGRFPLKNSCFLVQKYECVDAELGPHLKGTGIFSITDYGKKALQDYKKEIKSRRKELWMKNAWIPIFVSVITTLLTLWLKSIWPYIQQLLDHIF